ncbi:MAG: NAD-dependent epimerase/dehydratase family protein [Candidatus Nanoarchaeia archaeon]
MRILITGATGFIGFNLLKELQKEDHEFTITGHDAENRLKDFKGKYLQPSFSGIDWDAIGEVDIVYHLAAINDTTNYDDKEVMDANFHDSIRLFKHVIANGCKRIVYASSCAVYGDAPAPYTEDVPKNPLNPYGKSKLKLDQETMLLAKENPDVTFVGLRFSNVYGPGESHKGFRSSMALQWAHQMRKGNPKCFIDGNQKRDFVYVADAIKGCILASKAKKSCIVNIGSGKARSWNDMLKILNKVLKMNRLTKFIPNPYEDKYQTFTECDLTKAKEFIGFEPDYDLEKGLQAYFDSGEL